MRIVKDKGGKAAIVMENPAERKVISRILQCAHDRMIERLQVVRLEKGSEGDEQLAIQRMLGVASQLSCGLRNGLDSPELLEQVSTQAKTPRLAAKKRGAEQVRRKAS